MAAEEEEVMIEVEAAESVYGDDCLVIQRFPPHLQVHIKPRTADDSSQQFVEAILELRAGSQYPKEPPQIGITDSKGLDEVRQAHLITRIREKVDELSSCLMLVALCEEAVQVLSQMNHPDGNCPLCLYPLVKEDAHGNSWPFMKLMSCYHCFHSKCIIKWWNWLQQQNETDSNISNASLIRCSNLRNRTDLNGTVKNQGTCPVCRKVFQAMDIEHVLNLVQTYTSQLSLEETETNDDVEIHHSELENTRRKNFEALLKLQEENNGLIEPKRNEVLLPGVFLPVPVTPPSVPTEASAELQETSTTNTPTSETGPSRPLNKAGPSSHNNLTSPTNRPTSETGPRGPFNKAGTSSRGNFGMRKTRPRNTRNARPQNNQWVKKENGTMD